MSRYLIGIDLGTTNSALATIDLHHATRDGRIDVRPFPVPQLVAPGETKERPLLPSFLYLPGAHDLPPGSVALPWDPSRNYAVGEFARNHGGRVPGRLVSSAKSWLCHSGVDRSAALLPWSAPPDVPRISPVEASTRYLRHLVESWNWKTTKDRPDDRLEKQAVVLTVPASFDDVARNLTVEAAAKAGLENVVLLEEPQAAFYCWLATHSAKEAAALKPGARCLVVDVGGGTSDFSLIQAVEEKGEIGFVRQAVGDHLLLGGDNMDLALAKYVETKLPGAGRLDAAQYGLLTQACRQAKETLLGPNAPPTVPVTVVGRGRAVIGGTVSTTLSPEEVRKVIFDGFFPRTPRDAEPGRGARTGLHEMGLPYVSDPAVTRPLSAFLKNQLHDGAAEGPAALLFNGGVFQPASLRERLLDVMRGWYDRPGRPWQPLVLTNPSLDLAVASGAAYFAWLRHTGGRRIGGGIARSYYIGVASGEWRVASQDEQGEPTASDLLARRSPLAARHGCLRRAAAFGGGARDRTGETGAGTGAGPAGDVPPVYLHGALGRQGRRRAGGGAGATVADAAAAHHSSRRQAGGAKHVPVTLAARSTAIGTLELFCVAKEGGNRWRLEFNIRDLVKPPPAKEAADGEPGESATGDSTGVTDVWPEAQVQEAAADPRGLHRSGDGDAAGADQGVEGAGRPAARMADRAVPAVVGVPVGGRRRAAALAGPSVALVESGRLLPASGIRRPDGPVPHRAALEDDGSAAAARAPRVQEGGADFWILWRRVAGGLNPTLQRSLYERLRPALLPGKGKAGVKPNPNELAEMWRSRPAWSGST